jgi:hypothetical protein
VKRAVHVRNFQLFFKFTICRRDDGCRSRVCYATATRTCETFPAHHQRAQPRGENRSLRSASRLNVVIPGDGRPPSPLGKAFDSTVISYCDSKAARNPFAIRSARNRPGQRVCPPPQGRYDRLLDSLGLSTNRRGSSLSVLLPHISLL